MGFFNVLKKALGIVNTVADVAKEVTPMVGVAEAVVGEAVKAVKKTKKTKKGSK